MLKKILLLSALLASFIAGEAHATATGQYANYDCWGAGNPQQSITVGNLNTSCGYGNFRKLTTGNFNAAYGSYLGNNLTTGSRNLLMGYNFDLPTATTSNYLGIGTDTAVAISGNMVAGGTLKFLGESSLAADFPAAATTTLASVTGLTATLEAAKNYSFVARLFFDASAAGGHKYAIAGTATATSIKYQVNSLCNVSNLYTITSRLTALAGTASQVGCTAGYTEIIGTITSNTAGTINVQFAQSVASGTSTVLSGSTFIVREIQ